MLRRCRHLRHLGHLRVLALLGALLGALLARGVSGQEEEGGLRFGALLDLRVVSAPRETSFLSGGLGKVRFGGGGRGRAGGAHVAQASFALDVALSGALALHAQANLDPESYDRPGLNGLDLVEAYATARPEVSRTLGLALKAGHFFPPVSLEHDGFAWSTPRTLTPSALNSWIGEEVRVTGMEGTLHVLLPSSDLKLRGAAFLGNDPAGTLLAWRGWAVHDRQTGLSDRLPLAPIPEVGPGGDFPLQTPWTAPFREVDGRAGWYAGASWSRPQGAELTALRFDNGGDRTSLERGQYSWETRFVSAGARVPVATLELLAQGLDGRTRMGPGPAVDVLFRAAYLLAAARLGRHRVSVRGDLFATTDALGGDYGEHGWAATLAWSFAATERVRVAAEVVRVDSRREGRDEVGLAPRAIETLGTLALRVRI